LDVALALACRRASTATIRASAGEIHHRPAMHHACEIERIPIGEPDATMRFGLADLLRRWRAMDAVARRGQIDPDDADRILRPWPGYSGFSSSLLALSCSASLAQVCAISISRALLVLSVASRAKRRHSAARLWWSWNLGTEPSRCAATRKIAVRFLAIANVDKWTLVRDAIDQNREERLSLPGAG